MIGKLQFLRSLILSHKTIRKIVVIESDDWGSERIPNTKTRDALLNQGIDMTSNPHARLDTLERLDDLDALGNLLKDIEDKYHKKVKITTNFITANPDFEKIRQSQYQSYYFKSFDQNYLERDGNDQVLKKILELTEANFIKPQFHGREHINALLWLNELQLGNADFLTAFHKNTYAIDTKSGKSTRKNLMAALEYENSLQNDFVIKSIQEGHQIFKDIFGFASKTFIAPRYTWNPVLEHTFCQAGFTHIQTALFHQNPTKEGYQPIFHYTGQKNSDKRITFSTRNVHFEPAYGGDHWVQNAISKVDLAFRFKTPAIISTHRINFVGGLDDAARNNHIKQFKVLLETLIEKYPEIEFLSSDELATII